MDREQEEMQFLGIFGIYKEAYKIIFSWGKIFSQITLALILPLSFIFLAHIQISDMLFMKIIRNEIVLDETRPENPRYQRLTDVISSEWAYFWLFNAAYFTALLIFSLLSTAAVVYTIAAIYTGQADITFQKTMSVVPKVWKRLMVTFLWIFFAIFVYHVIAIFVIIVCALAVGRSNIGVVFFVLITILYVAGVVYLSIIWQLASVVSVLEEARGIPAMQKAVALIKGKMWVAIAIFLKLNLSLFAIKYVFKRLVVYGWTLGLISRVAYGILCLLLLFKLILFGLVIQTVVYFVCKSYHHENIDKSALSDHLEVYLGDYVPLKSKDVQLEQFQV